MALEAVRRSWTVQDVPRRGCGCGRRWMEPEALHTGKWRQMRVSRPPPPDLPLSLPRPQAVKPHQFPLTALLMWSCWLDVTRWEVFILFPLCKKTEVVMIIWCSRRDWKPRPKQTLNPPSNLACNPIVEHSASSKVPQLPILTSVLTAFPNVFHCLYQRATQWT